MALQGAVLADTVYNNIDNSIDSTVETMSLTAGGTTGLTSLSVTPANVSGDNDSVNGCNVKNTNSLTVSVKSSDTTVATVSPSSVTFTDCNKGQQLTIIPAGAGTATVSVSISANNTSGSFYLAPATFQVNVARPANTAPTVAVTGVTATSYEFGNVPLAQCSVTDKEDGPSTFDASLSAITGPRAGDGLGSQTATCSYTDHGDASGQNQLSATPASVTYSIVDTTKPLVTVTAPATTEATGPLTPVAFSASAYDAVDGSMPAVCTTAGGKTYASGDGFPVGTTTLTCAATDKAGNTGTADPFDVVVHDTTKPTITTPSNIVVGNDSSTGATVTYDAATATDLVDGSIPASCSPASGSQFALGTTTVTCSATDQAGNTATGTFTVEVQDQTKPVVTVPSDVIAEATGPDGAHVDYGTVSATDDVNGPLAVSCDKDTGTFPLGTTTVTCSATDKAGNTGDNSFTVTVHDTTAPAVSVPTGITREATSADGATVTFAASASDLVDETVQTTCAPQSGSTFALGATTVTCSATDQAGNMGTASFAVTVEDTTPPSVTVPKDATAEATGSDGAVVSYGDVSASDLVDGTLSPTCSQASDTQFPLGSTTVTCTATDAAGNTGQNSFTVNVVDTTPPSVQTPANLQVGNDAGAKGASSVSYGPATATDLVDGTADSVSCSPASGSAFPLGITTVTCTATDQAGNTGSAQFTVEVQDQNKPIVYVPSAVDVSATGPTGATYSWLSEQVYAVDDVDGLLPATCDWAPGDTFPIGTTTVTCSAADKAGNKADNTFAITVADDKAPVVSVPAGVTVAATSARGAVVNYANATATDNVDGSVPATCLPASGSVFPLGTTTVTCAAKDKAGNQDAKTFTVSVTTAWSGVLQPVNADGSSVFKLGSTVPVKFALTGASAGVKDLAARLYYARVGSAGTGTYDEATSTSAATTGNLFRYDATANQYIFNLGTKTLSSGTYTLRIDLGDGVVHTVNITLRP
jgi:hypothetical protein